MNVDTDTQYAFTHAIEEHLERAPARTDDPGAGVAKARYDPRSWGRPADLAMAKRVAEACDVLGSTGRTLKNWDPDSHLQDTVRVGNAAAA
jgi:fructose-bisphosphate aldolase class II